MVLDNTKCSSLAELEQCMACNIAETPALEEAILNLQAPISQAEVDFLTGTTDPSGALVGMDLFSIANPAGTTGASALPPFRTMSSGFARVGARLRCDFALDAVCFIFRVDPNSFTVDGNQYRGLYNADGTPSTAFPTAFLPGSPRHPNWSVMGPNGVPLTDWSNAQLEVGGAQWRAAYWAMQAFRMVMNCPSSCNSRELLNMKLADLGNCDLGTQQQGFSNTATPWIAQVRAANDRLSWLRSHAQLPILAHGGGFNAMSNGITSGSQDVGVFVPWNVDQVFTMDTLNAFRRLQSAYPLAAVPTAYGSMRTSPGAYKWYRPLRPRIIKHDENIEIYLKHDLQDSDFFDRFIRELSIDAAMTPLPSVAAAADQIPVGDGASYTSITRGAYVKFPFGVLSIGIILKGWRIDRGLCDTIYDRWNELTDAEFGATSVGQQRLAQSGLMTGEYGGPSMTEVLSTDPNVGVKGGPSCGCGR